MTKSEHERERRAFWDACCAAPYTYPVSPMTGPPTIEQEAAYCAELAAAKLAERDKVFPGPSEETRPRRSCYTCKSEKVKMHESPCVECNDGPGEYLSHWEPKP